MNSTTIAKAEAVISADAAWEKLVPPGTDILRKPFGPTLECFSIDSIVRLFRMGGWDQAVHHLSTCNDCQERVERLERYEQGAEAGLPMRRTAARAALLYVKDKFSVDPARPKEIPVRVQVITRQLPEWLIPDFAKSSSAESVRLEGAFEARGCQLSESGGYPVLFFPKARPSASLIDVLRHHRKTSQQVHLLAGTGHEPLLSGFTHVSFERAAHAG